MPGPSHLRVTLSGTFGPVASPMETWSTGLNVAQNFPSPFGYTEFPDAAKVDAVVAAANAWFTRPTSLFSSYQHLRQVTVALINDQGRTVVNTSGAYVQSKRQTGPTVGPTASSLHPYQVALVASLNTQRVGAVGRGRMFLPVHSGALGTDGRLSVADVTGVAASLTTFIQALNSTLVYPSNVTPEGPQPRVVVSSGGSVKLGIPPANYAVTSVRVGRVFDTMRSRRRSQVEEYVAGPAI